jgi:hypothetical protein
MKIPVSWPTRGIVALVAFLLFAPLASHADTYSVIGIETDAGHFFYGMDDVGHTTFSLGGSYLLNCGNAPNCYETLTYGANPVYSNLAPTYAWDFSATNACYTLPFGPCSATKNGRTVNFTGSQDLTRILSVTSGANPPQILPFSFNLTGTLVIDGTGDVLYDDGFGDIWYEAINLSAMPTTPEPASFFLLATAALGAGLFVRRNRRPDESTLPTPSL